MKVTNDELISAKRALGNILNERLPVKTAWELANVVGKIEDSIKAFALVRTGLFKKYDIKVKVLENGDSNLTSSIDGNVEKFSEEFDELLLQEVELVFKPVKLPSTLEIDTNTLIGLKKFVEI